MIFTINISFSIIRPSKRDTQSRCSLKICDEKSPFRSFLN
nr:MAG TPA: hypothetical protein [Bacteriophage sp.]